MRLQTLKKKSQSILSITSFEVVIIVLSCTDQSSIHWYLMADLDGISVSSFENSSKNSSTIHRKMKGRNQNEFIPNCRQANTEREDDKDVDQLFNNKTMDTSWKVCYGTTTIILSFLLFLWFYFEKFSCSYLE